MLCDYAICDDCQEKGLDCSCLYGPSYSRERKEFNETRTYFDYCVATAPGGQFQAQVRTKIGAKGQWCRWSALGWAVASLEEAEAIVVDNKKRDAFIPKRINRVGS